MAALWYALNLGWETQREGGKGRLSAGSCISVSTVHVVL